MRTVFLVLVMSCCLPVMAAVVQPLEGERIQGGSVSILDDGLVAIDGRKVALADCDWLAFRDPDLAPVPRGAQALSLVLADGSWLPADVIEAGADDALRVTLIGGSIELELGTVVGWGTETWLAGLVDSEQDVVQLGAERYRGAIQGISGGKLAIEVAELGLIELPLERVSGARLAEAAEAPEHLVLAANLSAGRPPVLLRPGPELTLNAAPTVVMPAPSGRLRVDGGRRVWLSDLEPSAVTEQGAFGVTWPYSCDRNLEGGPISLRSQGFQRGLVLHSEAALTWKLDGGFVRMVATVGIDDLVASEGDCSITVLLDGVVKWEQASVRGAAEPMLLDIDCTGAQKLEVKVGFGERYDIGDHLALAGAYLIRAKP
ncbi:MAG: NPCBM/NEW2 domain-containing protein [Planctomycetota bacterium]|nr:NPCBM/NEW2 domain-containing protein [Planctomycetota bacterium]